MDLFTPVPLSISGKAILLDGEVELKVEGRTIIFVSANKEPQNIFSDGLIVLTNHRVVYIRATQGGHVGWGFNMSTVLKMEMASSNIRILFSNSREAWIKFSSSRERDEFLDMAKVQLKKKSWITSAKECSSSQSIFSVANAGVGGLIRRQEHQMQSVDDLATEALTDLDALMRSAKSVVALVERFASSLPSDAKDVDETASELSENTELENIFQSIGMISPVTKLSAGRMFHFELGRQLADFLLAGSLLRRMGGTANLTDIYCMFNRARGTELVSPDDVSAFGSLNTEHANHLLFVFSSCSFISSQFLKASEAVGGLHVGIQFKRFSSGVLALQLEEMDEAYISQRIVQMCAQAEHSLQGVDATIVSLALGMTVTVAKEQLLQAERDGALCRDESVAGLFFFKNLFNEMDCH